MSDRVRASGVPIDALVVIGSGLLDQLGLRVSDDIDLVVTTEQFDRLAAASGSVLHGKRDTVYIQKDDCEIWTDWGTDYPFARLWSEGQTIDGIRFIATNTLIAKKRQRGLAKDRRDVALLEAYYHGKNRHISV